MLRKKAKEEFGRGSSRRSIMEKEWAMNRAKNPSESKFGGALLKGNSQESRLLSSELNKLNSQLRRQQMHIEQEKKQFLASRSLPDPILIVERPPSPEVFKKQLYASDPDYFDESNEPSYMRPTQARARTPSSIPSIEAYCVKTRRKKNLWEDAHSSNRKPRFQSTARPSWPLSEAEQLILARGWELHVKPPNADILLSSSNRSCSAGRHQYGRKKKLSDRETNNHSAAGASDTTFITEVPKMRYSTEGLGVERPTKNVSFADEVGLYFNALNEKKKEKAGKSDKKDLVDEKAKGQKSSRRKRDKVEGLSDSSIPNIKPSSGNSKGRKPISSFTKGHSKVGSPRTLDNVNNHITYAKEKTYCKKTGAPNPVSKNGVIEPITG